MRPVAFDYRGGAGVEHASPGLGLVRKRRGPKGEPQAPLCWVGLADD